MSRLTPSNIFYSQDSISNKWRHGVSGRHGKFIGETLDDICEGRCTVEDIPTISVKNVGGKWIAADNRRLWVFRHLEIHGKCETVPVRVTNYIPADKMTSKNGGASVKVRRNPGGRWYLQAAPSKARPPSLSTVAASRSFGHSMEGTKHQGHFIYFQNPVPPNNQRSFRSNVGAVDSTSQHPLSASFQRINITPTPRVTPTHHYQTNNNHQEYTMPTEVKTNSKRFLVCAIDFGTTYSGWAYSFKDDYEKNPTQSYMRQWPSGSRGFSTEKTPTVALISPNGRTLEAFGYEAEDEYQRLITNNDYEQYYLFRRFKMSLFKKLGEGITRNIFLEDELGKQLPALDVFAMSIKYLTDDLKENIRGLVDDDCIDWVITVPAIWTDAAKQFMREAGIQAGISSERLTLALEPEAASLLCRHLTSDAKVGEGDVSKPTLGSKYLIFDAGGGTVDITLHQVGPSDTLHEVKPACGADCGGTMVDNAFEDLMVELVGKDVYTIFRTTETDDFMDFLRGFESKKREAGRHIMRQIVVRIPPALVDIYHDATNRQLSDDVSRSKYASVITLERDRLNIDANFFESLFEKSITNALVEVQKILQNENLSSIHAIYMVGGYSQSPVLQKRIKEAFPTVNVVIPHDASACVLKGALIYGHNPTTISERVLRYTYGIAVRNSFDPNLHPLSKQIMTEEGLYCNNVFSVHARKSQSVHIGTLLKRLSYAASTTNQPAITIRLYASDKEFPRFVDELGCRKIGEIEFKFEEPYAMKYPKATVSMTFSGTEIVVEAVEVATGKKITSNINFLG